MLLLKNKKLYCFYIALPLNPIAFHLKLQGPL